MNRSRLDDTPVNITVAPIDKGAIADWLEQWISKLTLTAVGLNSPKLIVEVLRDATRLEEARALIATALHGKDE